jgi:hypothetical protein
MVRKLLPRPRGWREGLRMPFHEQMSDAETCEEQ